MKHTIILLLPFHFLTPEAAQCEEVTVRLQLLDRFDVESYAISDIGVDPGQRRIVGLEYRERGDLVVWSQEDAWTASTLVDDVDFSREFDIHESSEQTAIASDYFQIRVINSRTGELRQTVFPGIGELYCVRISRDGTKMASGSRHGRIWIGQYDEGEQAWQRWKVVHSHVGWTSAVAFSSTGEVIASVGFAGIVKVRDLGMDHEAELRLDGGGGCTLGSIALDSAGEIALLGGGRWRTDRADPIAVIWNVAADTTIDLEGHTDFVSDVEIISISDVEVGVTASYDGTVRLWNLENGELLRTERPDGSALHTMRCAGTPPLCAVATSDGEVVVYEIRASIE